MFTCSQCGHESKTKQAFQKHASRAKPCVNKAQQSESYIERQKLMHEIQNDPTFNKVCKMPDLPPDVDNAIAVLEYLMAEGNNLPEKCRTKSIKCRFNEININIEMATFDTKEEPIDLSDDFYKDCFHNADKGVHMITPLTFVTVTTIK